jgi:beta-phosphoglucomutase
MISAIVFDFDGVIADSEVLHLKAYQQVLGPLGVELSRETYFARYLGFDDPGVFRAVAADHALPLGAADLATLIDRKAGIFEQLEAGADMLFPGAEQCVRSLAEEFPLGIASGAMRHEIENVLHRSALRDYFRFIVASGDTPANKPAPDPYLRAAALHARAPEECVAVEDSRWGMESARTAGLACIGITHTYPRDQLGNPHVIIDSLAELTPALIRSLRPG